MTSSPSKLIQLDRTRRLLYLLLVLNLLFIWGNSALSGKLSHSISDLFVYGFESAVGEGEEPSSSASSNSTSSKPEQVIVGNTDPVIKDKLDTDWRTGKLRTIFRKGAHALEYMTLGVICLLLFGLKGSSSERVMRLLLMGGFVALVDETVQIFSKRTSNVGDIWLDIAGFLAGCGIIMAIRYLRRRRSA